MSDTPFVSIIVPLYNEERRVDECVRALLAQDYPADR
jgi:glycosyltransferase involved in cell wall biosynthesis